jgi:hypothetical protein
VRYILIQEEHTGAVASIKEVESVLVEAGIACERK